MTNSHVIRPGIVDAILFRMADTDPDLTDSYIRMLPDQCYDLIKAESLENDEDYAILDLAEPEFKNKYRFTFEDSNYPNVGEEVIFLGFPFGMSQLTAHIGHISSIHNKGSIRVIQIDGSINGGNSGGPLINSEGKIIGIVTRAVTGLIDEQFRLLIDAFHTNQKALQGVQGLMRIGTIDPIQAFRVSQSAMEQIAKNLYRSANVGIGYAYSSEHILRRIQQKN